MADRVDNAIKDFVTGKLDTKIQARRLWLARRVPPENIGGSRVRNTTAPQEWLIIKYDEDEELNRLENQKEIISLWWGCESSETRKIVLLKYRDNLQWWQIAERLYIGESTARMKYNQFKDMVFTYL